MFAIDTVIIQSELQELAGSLAVKVQLKRKMDTASRLICTDGGYKLLLNPSRIRSQDTLEQHLGYARGEI